MLKLVYVNQEQLDYEREMNEWLERIRREGRCVACENLGAEYFDETGIGMCEQCIGDLS